ncbi:hypothetical protein MRX96_043367 [Rhipicephalus microplus]
MTKSGPPECLGGARRHPPPAGGDGRPTTPSSSIATIRAGRLPDERAVWTPRVALPVSSTGTEWFGSPSTPPEYYAPRATTPRAPTNRIALAAALESTRDRAAASHD